jgi:hypothetical protein
MPEDLQHELCQGGHLDLDKLLGKPMRELVMIRSAATAGGVCIPRDSDIAPKVFLAPINRSPQVMDGTLEIESSFERLDIESSAQGFEDLRPLQKSLKPL